MSVASKATLSLACLISGGIIVFVHFKQYTDQKKLRDGIFRDSERLELKKMEKMYWFQKQIEVTKILKKEQSQDGKVDITILKDLSR